MLDVHPPHHAANTWRDFFIHIATIVLGLCIAVGLEQTVEYIHHRHLVAEARDTLREEMSENQKLIRHDMDVLKQDDLHLRHNIVILQRQKDHPSANPEKLNISWEWDGPLSAAWNSARDTGALALMPYSDVQHYSFAYIQQDNVEQNATNYLRLHTQAFSPMVKTNDLATLPPAELDKLIDGIAITITQEQFLYYLARSLDRNYTHALAIQ